MVFKLGSLFIWSLPRVTWASVVLRESVSRSSTCILSLLRWQAWKFQVTESPFLTLLTEERSTPSHPIPYLRYIIPSVPGGVKISRWQKSPSMIKQSTVTETYTVCIFYLPVLNVFLFKGKCSVRCLKHVTWVYVGMHWVQIHRKGK